VSNLALDAQPARPHPNPVPNLLEDVMTRQTALHQATLATCCAVLMLPMGLFTGLPAQAKAAKLPQRDFLPPIATINGSLATPAANGAEDPADPLEPVTLSAVGSPVVKINKPVVKLDNDLGIRTTSDEYQELLRSQKALDEEDLRSLWEAIVEKNPVIRFSLEKLSTPPDLQNKKSSQFMNKTLNVLISGATLAATMAPGGSYYRNVGAMAGGDAVRNILNGRTQPLPNTLTATEQIQLAGLVDELQAKLVQTYHDYKNTLQSLVTARQTTVQNNALYNKALQSGNNLAIVAAGSAYYKALLHETELRQKAKLSRLRLERLAGDEALRDLKLSLIISKDITEGNQPTPGNGNTVSTPPAPTQTQASVTGSLKQPATTAPLSVSPAPKPESNGAIPLPPAPDVLAPAQPQEGESDAS
jgi:hypothetical protein